MDTELISKKDLLTAAGISYGQLYRWKRKGLIPEDWFIHKATFTGQETFFPKSHILARIEQIKHLKDDASLDALAHLFSPDPTGMTIAVDDALARGILTRPVVDFYSTLHELTMAFTFHQLLAAYLIETLFQAGTINREEGGMLLSTFEEHYPAFANQPCDLLILRKYGISACCLVSNSGLLVFDNGVKVAVRLHIPQYIEQLKLKLV